MPYGNNVSANDRDSYTVYKKLE